MSNLHTFKPISIVTGLASGAIIKHRFINYSDAVCNAIGQLAKGVSYEEDSDINKAFAIITEGTALVETAAVLAAGDRVTTNGVGKAIKAAKGRYVNGVAMRAQTVVGQLCEIRLGGNVVSTEPSTTSTTTTSSSSSSSTTSTAA
jgi:hypothetical protein